VIRRESQRHESHLEIVVCLARRHWHYHVDILGGTHADYRRIGDEQLGHLTADEHELSKQWP
jgi:hypothetical protein